MAHLNYITIDMCYHSSTTRFVNLKAKTQIEEGKKKSSIRELNSPKMWLPYPSNFFMIRTKKKKQIVSCDVFRTIQIVRKCVIF